MLNVYGGLYTHTHTHELTHVHGFPYTRMHRHTPYHMHEFTPPQHIHELSLLRIYTHTHIYGLRHIWVPMYTHIVKAKFFLVETKALVGKETTKPQTPVWEVLWHNQG